MILVTNYFSENDNHHFLRYGNGVFLAVIAVNNQLSEQ